LAAQAGTPDGRAAIRPQNRFLALGNQC